MPNTADRNLFIDGDALLYKAAAAVSNEIWWDEDTRVASLNVREAVAVVLGQISNMTSVAKVDKAIFVMGAGSRNYFRRRLWPDYKKNRKSQAPVGYHAMKDRFLSTYEGEVIVASEGLEADDTLGVEMTRPQIYDYVPQTLWSPDKDLLQIPGWHLDIDKEEVFVVTVEQADRYHLYQTLVGDTSDGYPGCPGIGPKRAEEILTGPDVWGRIVGAYCKAGKTGDDALVQARVSRILRYGELIGGWTPPVNTQTGEVTNG